jgi:hypothetical protein
MTHPIIRAAAWLLNRSPAWIALWVPQAVMVEALEELRCREALAIAATRHRLQLMQLKEQIEALEREVGS